MVWWCIFDASNTNIGSPRPVGRMPSIAQSWIFSPFRHLKMLLIFSPWGLIQELQNHGPLCVIEKMIEYATLFLCSVFLDHWSGMPKTQKGILFSWLQLCSFENSGTSAPVEKDACRAFAAAWNCSIADFQSFLTNQFRAGLAFMVRRPSAKQDWRYEIEVESSGEHRNLNIFLMFWCNLDLFWSPSVHRYAVLCMLDRIVTGSEPYPKARVPRRALGNCPRKKWADWNRTWTWILTPHLRLIALLVFVVSVFYSPETHNL